MCRISDSLYHLAIRSRKRINSLCRKIHPFINFIVDISCYQDASSEFLPENILGSQYNFGSRLSRTRATSRHLSVRIGKFANYFLWCVFVFFWLSDVLTVFDYFKVIYCFVSFSFRICFFFFCCWISWLECFLNEDFG